MMFMSLNVHPFEKRRKKNELIGRMGRNVKGLFPLTFLLCASEVQDWPCRTKETNHSHPPTSAM